MKKPLQIHIPKTGGTSIAKMLPVQRWARRHPNLSSDKYKSAIVGNQNTHLFTFMRCPLDRAVSIYYFFVWSKKQDRSKPNIAPKSRAMAWVLSCATQAAGMDINEFWRGFLRDEGLQVTRISHAIAHFRKQSSWIDSSPLSGRVNYYDFGKFNEEARRLQSDLGCEFIKDIPHRMKSVKRKTWQDELAPDVEQLLREWYAEDFEFMRSKGLEVS